MKAHKPIGIIHSLGGCGGTLLAQCIGVMQNVIFLSECNPLSARLFNYNLNPLSQIKKWHPDLYRLVKDEFNEDDLQSPLIFNHFISKTKQLVEDINHHLIIRDYNYIDYFGLPFLTPPPMNSSLIKSLENSFTYQQVILVRHPLKQYNSLRSHDILKNILRPGVFLQGYKHFLADFSDCKIIKYEDIVTHPGESISGLSAHFRIPFSNDFISKFHQNEAVTGNFKRLGETQITLSKERVVQDEWTNELLESHEYQSLLSALGY